MRMILVPVADRPECAHALRAAFQLGRRLNASLTGCHIRAHTDSSVRLSAIFSAHYFTPGSSDLDKEWTSKTTVKASQAAHKLFKKIVADNDYELIKRPRPAPGAIWLEKVGAPNKVLRVAGPVHDLTVVTRPGSKGSNVARLFLLSALMETGRPVLILPPRGKSQIGKNICIAWNQSHEAARAVTSALPLLQAAEQVTVITSGPDNQLGPKTGQLVNYLRAWDIKAKTIKTRGKNTEQELLDAYNESGSDLLVMGAYSRSRWRERIFGGTSQFMLSEAKIPVLMQHS